MKYPYGFITEQFHHGSLFEATQEFLSIAHTHSSEQQLSLFAFLVPK